MQNIGSNCRIDVLLSTHNGARYLADQIESIFRQDIGEWRLIIRDDASNDHTLEVIERFRALDPIKITVLEEPGGRLGVVKSYEYLLRNSSSPYIAFCDQDDVWLPEKLRLLRERIQQLEEEFGTTTPILVHSDLTVVNEHLEMVADSFWRHQKLDPRRMQSLPRLLMQNCVTGCATLINRALANLALPIPEDAIMHDWWLALHAVSDGRIEVLNQRTVKYRQHHANDTGAKEWKFEYVLSNVIQGRKQLRSGLLKTRRQARALLESGHLSGERYDTVSRYVGMYDLGWLGRRWECFRMGFYKYGFVRNVGLMFIL
ncbi:MAG: glycosyltransferase family 2 protein [Gammaproteobacteria bacterium]|nr:glycosyltransferase family 2 protein [Gammaproteobacteria bacterium]